MGNFIKGLISRHHDPVKNVLPKLPGRFESPYYQVNQPNIPDPVFNNPGGKQPNSVPATQDPVPLNMNNSSESSAEKVNHAASSEDKSQNGIPRFPLDNDPTQINQDSRLRRPLIPQSNSTGSVFPPSQQTILHKAAPLMNDESSNPGQHNPALQTVEQSKTTESIIEKGKSHDTQKGPVLSPVTGFTEGKRSGLFGEPPGAGYRTNSDRHERSSENSGRNDSEPVIKVTIGQINVRAITQAPVPTGKITGAPKPALSLDEYLKQRNKRQS